MSTGSEPEVGSPAWLELQHQKERAKEGALTKAPSTGVEVVLGAVLVLIGIGFNVALMGGNRTSLFGFTAYGFVMIRMAPIALGLAVIYDGIRRRRG